MFVLAYSYVYSHIASLSGTKEEMSRDAALFRSTDSKNTYPSAQYLYGIMQRLLTTHVLLHDPKAWWEGVSEPSRHGAADLWGCCHIACARIPNARPLKKHSPPTRQWLWIVWLRLEGAVGCYWGFLFDMQVWLEGGGLAAPYIPVMHR